MCRTALWISRYAVTDPLSEDIARDFYYVDRARSRKPFFLLLVNIRHVIVHWTSCKVCVCYRNSCIRSQSSLPKWSTCAGNKFKLSSHIVLSNWRTLSFFFLRPTNYQILINTDVIPVPSFLFLSSVICGLNKCLWLHYPVTNLFVNFSEPPGNFGFLYDVMIVLTMSHWIQFQGPFYFLGFSLLELRDWNLKCFSFEHTFGEETAHTTSDIAPCS